MVKNVKNMIEDIRKNVASNAFWASNSDERDERDKRVNIANNIYELTNGNTWYDLTIRNSLLALTNNLIIKE